MIKPEMIEKAEMNLTEAVNSVISWLYSTEQISLTLYRAQQVETNYKVSIHQVLPEDKYRAFNIAPTDIANCWNVVEVAFE